MRLEQKPDERISDELKSGRVIGFIYHDRAALDLDREHIRTLPGYVESKIVWLSEGAPCMGLRLDTLIIRDERVQTGRLWFTCSVLSRLEHGGLVVRAIDMSLVVEECL